MITMTVREAAEARGVTSSYQLLEKLAEVGYKTYPNMASKLWKNQMVTLPTLDKVAEALDCKLDELIVWQSNKSVKTSKTNGRK